MKRIAPIDFAGARAAHHAGLALCATAVLLLAAAGTGAWQLQQHNRALAARAGTGVHRSVAHARPVDALLVRQVHAVAGQLAAPWDELLAVFEEHSTPAVGLLKLEPDAQGSVLRLNAQAASTQAMVDYLAALEADPRLARVVLLQHQLEREVPGRPVSFQLSAAWRRAPVPAPRVAAEAPLPPTRLARGEEDR